MRRVKFALTSVVLVILRLSLDCVVNKDWIGAQWLYKISHVLLGYWVGTPDITMVSPVGSKNHMEFSWKLTVKCKINSFLIFLVRRKETEIVVKTKSAEKREMKDVKQWKIDNLTSDAAEEWTTLRRSCLSETGQGQVCCGD